MHRLERLVHSRALPDWTTEPASELLRACFSTLEALAQGPPVGMATSPLYRRRETAVAAAAHRHHAAGTPPRVPPPPPPHRAGTKHRQPEGLQSLTRGRHRMSPMAERTTRRVHPSGGGLGRRRLAEAAVAGSASHADASGFRTLPGQEQEPFFTHSSAQWAQLDDVDVADERSLSHPVPAIHALRGTLVGAFGGLHEANGPAASTKPIQASRAWMLFVLEHAARTLAGA